MLFYDIFNVMTQVAPPSQISEFSPTMKFHKIFYFFFFLHLPNKLGLYTAHIVQKEAIYLYDSGGLRPGVSDSMEWPITYMTIVIFQNCVFFI